MPASPPPTARPHWCSATSLTQWAGWLLLGIIVVIAALAAQPPGALTIETGPIGGSYHRNALGYQKALAANGIELRLKPNPNSIEIIRNVGDPASDTDAGFIAQDVSTAHGSAIYQIGQIELQPLFMFASAELGRRSTLIDLRGRRIVMPPSDSATSRAALRVLQLYGITNENSRFTFMPLDAAVAALQAGQFEAGVFMLAADNPIIRTLMHDSSLFLVPTSEARAITKQLLFLRPVVLSRGTYNVADAIPPNNITLVAAQVGVVVRQGLHPYLIYRLLDAMVEVHRGPTLVSEAGDFPAIAGAQLVVDPRAAEYYRAGIPWLYRTLPPWLASIIDRYQLVLFGLALFGCVCLGIRYLIGCLCCLVGSVRARQSAPEQAEALPRA